MTGRRAILDDSTVCSIERALLDMSFISLFDFYCRECSECFKFKLYSKPVYSVHFIIRQAHFVMHVMHPLRYSLYFNMWKPFNLNMMKIAKNKIKIHQVIIISILRHEGTVWILKF